LGMDYQFRGVRMGLARRIANLQAFTMAAAR
jgi:hypothetical protein